MLTFCKIFGPLGLWKAIYVLVLFKKPRNKHADLNSKEAYGQKHFLIRKELFAEPTEQNSVLLLLINPYIHECFANHYYIFRSLATRILI